MRVLGVQSQNKDALTTRSMNAPSSISSTNDQDTGGMRQPNPFAILSNMAGRSNLEIGIHLANDGHVYRNLDRVHGTLVIKATCDTPFETVEIAFVGASHTRIERYGGHTLSTDISRASHEFINTAQTHMDQHLPVDRILRAGRTYTFPIDLTIPDCIEWTKCRHSVDSVAVRDAHRHLPPTFNDCGDLNISAKRKNAFFGGATVRYRVRATVTRGSYFKGKKSIVPVISYEHGILVLPASRGFLPISMDRTREAAYETHQFKHRLQSRCLGTLTVAMLYAPTLLSPTLGAKIGIGDRTFAFSVALHYRPGHASMELPHLKKIVSKLKSYTYYSTSPYTDFPSTRCSKEDSSKVLWSNSTKLASRDATSIPWNTDSFDDFNSSSDDFGCTESSVNVQDAHFVSKLVIPVEIPFTEHLIPTFHSCLIGHFHEITLSLSFGLNGLKKDVKVRMPLHIASLSK